MATAPQSRPFLDDNWEQIKCLSLAATDAVFSAYMAVNSFEPGGVVWWVYAYDSISSVAQLFSCAPPPRSAFETAFNGPEYRCQCAEVAGELFLEYLDAVGNLTRVSMSSVTGAKSIQTSTVSGSDAICNWTTDQGGAATATYDIGLGTRPIWYIVPTLNTGCCSGSPVIPPTQPFPDPYVFMDPTNECTAEVTLLDSCIDRFGLSQITIKLLRILENVVDKI